MGCWAKGKPRPYEYKRDLDAPRKGFLTQKESDDSWAIKDDISTYTMQVTLGADWFRDEFQHMGELRPMQELHSYFMNNKLSQQLRWDAERQQYEFVDSDDRVIYRALLQPELNPVPYTNDALFGLLDGENDEYDTLDEQLNALVMIPCLTRCDKDPSKAVLSSVWAYPRHGWKWNKGIEQEVTIGYHWPLENWMVLARGMTSTSQEGSRHD